MEIVWRELVIWTKVLCVCITSPRKAWQTMREG
jgi:hypothetical protein